MLSPPPHEMKSRLTELAGRLGFADCRIAKVAGPAAHAPEFQQWVAEGAHGDMAWMARNVERRCDPREVLEGVKSVVVVALNYFQGRDEPVFPAARGRIARYAWGEDYHDLMDGKLQAMVDIMTAWGGTQKLYVDTGPVLERDWASAAGLGWNGKSTVQIHNG